LQQGGVWWCNHPCTCGGIGVASSNDKNVRASDSGVWERQCMRHLFLITDFQYRHCQKHVSESKKTQYSEMMTLTTNHITISHFRFNF
jgi:hypothetical protein